MLRRSSARVRRVLLSFRRSVPPQIRKPRRTSSSRRSAPRGNWPPCGFGGLGVLEPSFFLGGFQFGQRAFFAFVAEGFELFFGQPFNADKAVARLAGADQL